MSEEQGRPRGKLGMPVHIARQKLMEQPETKQIAESLGVDLETYVDRVMHFAQNPEAQPEFHVIDDEDLAEAGVQVPSLNEVQGWFEGVESGEVPLDEGQGLPTSDGFGTDRDLGEHVREAAGFKVERRAPQQEQLAGQISAPEGDAGAVLRRQLMEQQRATRLSLDAQRNKVPKK